MKSKKISIVAIVLVLIFCHSFKNSYALVTLEERFKVILANSSGSLTKSLNIDLSGVNITENPSVRYYCEEDVRGTVYNSIAPATGTQLIWYDADKKVNKNWYSLGGNVSGNWSSNTASTLTFNTVDVTATTPYVRLPKVSKTGYTFTGWTISETQRAYYYFNGALRSTVGSSSISSKDGWYQIEVGMTSNALTVKPTFKINNYTVKFDDGMGNILKTQNVSYSSSATPPTPPTRPGYTFSGWNESYTNITSNKTIIATWTPTTYSISYELDGGTVSNNPSSYNITSPTFTLKNPTKVGHTFLGWTGSNSNTAQTNVTISNGSIGNKNYIANWLVNTYTIHFNPNGGSLSSSDKTVKYGQNYGDLPVPTKEGYIFNGWFTAINGGVLVNSSSIMGTENITLYAQWVPIILDVTVPESLDIYQIPGKVDLKINVLSLQNNCIGTIDISKLKIDLFNGYQFAEVNSDFKRMPFNTKKIYLAFNNYNLMNNYNRGLSISPNGSLSVQLNGKMGGFSYNSKDQIATMHLIMKVRGQ